MWLKQIWLAALIALGTVLGSQLDAHAQTPTITLTVTPATLKLAPGEQTEVLITFTNPLTTTLQGLNLTWFGDAGVDVVIKSPVSNALVPQATAAWTVTVAKKPNGNATGTLHLRVDYTTTLANQSIANIARGVLDIQDRSSEPLEKIAQARIETTLETVQERRTGFVYLIVNNIATVPITITRVLVHKPAFVNIILPEKANQQILLAPQEAVVLEYQVEGAEQVQSGKHALVLETEVTWQSGNQTWKGTLTTSHKFNVGVLGESEILIAIGVPSFLLLPGFLMVAAFRFFKTRVFPKEASTLELKSPEFWMLAVLFSGFAAFAYPYLTTWIRWLGPPRDYLTGYGLRDIMIVWSGSVLLGVLAWSVWYGGGKLIRWTLLRNVPTENDSEIQTMQKLAGNKMGFALEQATIRIGAEEQRVFILERERASRSKVWVAPAIRYTVVSTKLQQITNAFSNLLDQTDNAGDMAFIMREGINAGMLKFEWETSGILHSPTEIEKSAIIQRMGKRRILVEQE
ncbi:MAG: hypothetical protein HY868_25380 [Chloroflexi bacterium]|nr:hypothetical protein [Chloroflexota bacterium]